MTTVRAAHRPSLHGRWVQRHCYDSDVESATMQTHTIYTNLSESVTLVCAQCRRRRALRAAAVKDLPQPLKVRCPCGATFGVHIIIRPFYRKTTRLPGTYVK